MKKRAKKMAIVMCEGGDHTPSIVDSMDLHGDCHWAMEACPAGIKACQDGCLGLGSCVAVCKLNAVKVNEFGVAEIILEKCVGCGLCVKACPKNLIEIMPIEYSIMPRCKNTDKGAEARKVCEVSCIACRICERNCPVDAITMIDNHAVIDKEKCVVCGMCATKCPRKTIVDADGIFTD